MDCKNTGDCGGGGDKVAVEAGLGGKCVTDGGMDNRNGAGGSGPLVLCGGM